MISAMPRYSASVPMVTASEGSPSLVTSRPLTRPAARPSSTRTAKMASIGQCLAHRNPSSALDMPSVDATERSISPLMTISVMGSAMIAISPDVTSMLKMFPLVRNCAGPPRSGADTGTPSSQGGRQPHRDQPVQRDGHQQQEAGDRLVPERRNAEHVQRRVDRDEQQRADGRAHR